MQNVFPEYMNEYIQSIRIFIEYPKVVPVVMEIMSHSIGRKDGRKLRSKHQILEIGAGCKGGRVPLP